MYDNTIKFVLPHLGEICREAAETVHATGPAYYKNFSLPALTNGLRPVLEMQLRYISTGDLTEWRESITKGVQERLNQGDDYAGVIKVGQTVMDTLRNFLHRELPQHPDLEDLPPDKLLVALQRRFDSLALVATTVSTAEGIKQRQQHLK